MLRTSGLGLGVGSRAICSWGPPGSCCDIIRNGAYSAPPKLLSVDQVMGRFPCGTALLLIFPALQRCLPKEHCVLPFCVWDCRFIPPPSLSPSFLLFSSYFSSLLLSESPYSFSLLICASSSICFKLFTHFFHTGVSPRCSMSLRPTLYSKGSPLLYPCSSISSSNAFKNGNVLPQKVVYSFLGVVTYLGASMVTQRSRIHLPMQEMWVPFYLLEEEMASHSSVLAWRIPWREEPGGL